MTGEYPGKISCTESRPTILLSRIPSRTSPRIRVSIARQMVARVSARSRQLPIHPHARSSHQLAYSPSEFWAIQCSLERPTGWQPLSIILKIRSVHDGEYSVPTNKSEHPVPPTHIPIPLLRIWN